MSLLLPFLLLVAVRSYSHSTSQQLNAYIYPLYHVPSEAAQVLNPWVRQFRLDDLQFGSAGRDNLPDTLPRPVEYPFIIVNAYDRLNDCVFTLASGEIPADKRMEAAKKILRNSEHARLMSLYLALQLDMIGANASRMASDLVKWRLAAAKYVETHFGDAKTGELPKASQPQHHGIPGLPRR